MKPTLFLPLALTLLLSGCGSAAPAPEAPSADEPATRTLFAMDTVMDLTVYGEETLLDQAENTILTLEEQLSVTREDSEIYAVNQTGSGSLSPQSADMLQQALSLCHRTQGALDITIYPVVRAWGFTTGDYQVPEESALQELLTHVDYTGVQFDAATSTVTLEDGMELDLGSVAKGYTGDLVLSQWREAGVTSALLNLGGNVQTLGSKPDGSPWRVAVQDPTGEGYLGVVEVTDQAVITSGGYERYFEEDGVTYWHIISPITGKPAHSGLLSVTIIGDQGVTCDGLSTALFVMGLDTAADLWRDSDDFQAIFYAEDGTIYLTEGIADSFTPLETYADAEIEVISRD